MSQLDTIQDRAKRYADAREQLGALVAALNEAIEVAKRTSLPEIRRAIRKVAEQHDALKGLVEASPDLFVRPRTVVFHGIKLGYQKGKGGIEIENPEQTIKLIRKHFPEQAEVLIDVKEAPAKKALAQLNVADLKKVGATVVETGDEIVIKATDSEVDKIVARLIADAVEDEGEAA